MSFRKGGGVIFNQKIYVTKFRHGYLTMKFEGFEDSLKNLQHNFPKMRGAGGVQRPFGTFPKIHLFWKGSASLREGFKSRDFFSSVF